MLFRLKPHDSLTRGAGCRHDGSSSNGYLSAKNQVNEVGYKKNIHNTIYFLKMPVYTGIKQQSGRMGPQWLSLGGETEVGFCLYAFVFLFPIISMYSFYN